MRKVLLVLDHMSENVGNGGMRVRLKVTGLLSNGNYHIFRMFFLLTISNILQKLPNEW